MPNPSSAALRAAAAIADSMKASYLVGDNWIDLFARIIDREWAAERDAIESAAANNRNRPYRMPPSKRFSGPDAALIGPNIEEFSVGSWCPTPDGSGPATAVAISARIRNRDGTPMDIVIRIKSPQELDRVVQMLLRHKRDTWPEAS